MNDPIKEVYSFGPFLLHVHERLLLRDGSVVTLPAKVFDTLVVLVQHNGLALEKETLIRTLWPDTFVEEGNLTQNVSRLRKVLGGGEASYIATLPRRGYRFTADVSLVDPAQAALVLRRETRRARLTITDEIVIDDGPNAVLPENSADPRTIAILPFITLGLAAENEYLGLGLADALITQLGSTRQLTVRPTSAVRPFADTNEDSVGIGRKLRVGAVLEGSVQMAAERLRITVQLVGVAQGAPLWAQKFTTPFTDIFDVQDTIAERVADALLLNLNQAERSSLVRRYTDNAEAYTSYLQGRFHWNKRTVEGHRQAIANFEQAISLDPNYALAYAGLADCYNMLPVWGDLTTLEACPRARVYAERALEIDETLAEAHAALGYTLAHFGWDFSAAERSYRRALELNPNYASAHQWYAKLLVALERFDEAQAEMAVARSLDPLSLMVGTACGGPLLYSGQYEQAIEQFQRVLELDPNFIPALYSISVAYCLNGQYDQAVAAVERMQALSGEHPLALASLAATYAVAGREAEARKALNQVLEIAQHRHVLTYAIAVLYAGLGEVEPAFEWLEVAFTERDGHLVDLRIEPFFGSLRSDARFEDLVRRVGLDI